MHAAEKENDLNDTNKGLEDDKKFLAGIKYLTEGWAAFTDTITVLTDDDDDALELFKKLPLSVIVSFKSAQHGRSHKLSA